jgi:hypothetical protein
LNRFIQCFSASIADGYPRAFFLQALTVANPMPPFPSVTTTTFLSSLFMLSPLKFNCATNFDGPRRLDRLA